MRIVFVLLLVLDLLVFCYYVGVTIYELTYDSADALVYQRINVVHIFATLFFFWIVIEYKKPRRMYAFYFFIVLVVDILDGLFVFLKLSNGIPILKRLEMANAGLNIATSFLITGAYLLVANGVQMPGDEPVKKAKSRIIKLV